MNFPFPYPRVTSPVPPGVTAVNKSYKARVLQVFAAILGFAVGYIAVIVITGIIIYYAFVGGILILTATASFFTIVAGLGILFMSGLLAFFVLKFLFTNKKEEAVDRIEITREGEPMLFAFVEEVCNECKTSFPKKIYISPGVNASVFYSSSLWSLVWPVRKNLEIGGALVSSLNVSEFKAVIAHEFGHFSQSSTKLGSYIYRINRVIYNAVYENDSFDAAIQKLSGIHTVINIFLHITVGIVKGIIWVYSQLYKLVNLSHAALSRQMEFHADSVSVSVAGSAYIGRALYRLDFGDFIFTQTANLLSQTVDKENKLPGNFYTVFSQLLPAYAALSNYNLQNGLPDIDPGTVLTARPVNRVVIKNLWASHPGINERNACAMQYNIMGDLVDVSPWLLFADATAMQIKLSNIMYAQVLAQKQVDIVDTDAYVPFVNNRIQHITYHPAYCGYYSSPYFPMFTLDEVAGYEVTPLGIPFDGIFNKDTYNRLQRYDTIKEDLETVNALKEGAITVRRFEFEGKQYARSHAHFLAVDLRQQLEQEEGWLTQLHRNVYLFFYQQLGKTDNVKQQQYKELYVFSEKLAAHFAGIDEIREKAIKLYHQMQEGVSQDHVKHAVAALEQYYRLFEQFKDNLDVPHIPTMVTENGIMTDYKEAVFAVPVPHPTHNTQLLYGLYPFIHNLGATLDNITELRMHVMRLSITLQDECLPQQQTIAA